MADENYVLYKTIYKLVYKGKLVGYRIKHSQDKLIDTDFQYLDIDLELLTMVNEDLGGYAVQVVDCPTVNYISKGEYLVPEKPIEPYKDLPILTYNKFMESQCAKYTPLFKTMIELTKCDEDLKKLYNHYNKLIFGGKLPYDVPVYYDPKLKSSAGMCNYKVVKGTNGKDKLTFRLRLSPSYVERFPEDDYRDILIHEMIHIELPHETHGKGFKMRMHQINRDFGTNVTVYCLGYGDYNYRYRCTNPKCDKIYDSVRGYKKADNYRCKCGARIYLYEDRKKGLLYNQDGEVIGKCE